MSALPGPGCWCPTALTCSATGWCSPTCSWTRNDAYWDAANTEIDEVWYYALENPDAELKRYRAGELEVTSAACPTTSSPGCGKTSAMNSSSRRGLGSYYFGFNLTKPPFEGRAGAAYGPGHGHRPGRSHGEGYRCRRNSRLWLGAASGGRTRVSNLNGPTGPRSSATPGRANSVKEAGYSAG